mmetsp:Transcript_62941/g.148200  ORF Transcript_62941/g.148200 Transcript_62941/m.148200 type:complete len:201 (-) Transcript_62941:605-1207(-)
MGACQSCAESAMLERRPIAPADSHGWCQARMCLTRTHQEGGVQSASRMRSAFQRSRLKSMSSSSASLPLEMRRAARFDRGPGGEAERYVSRRGWRRASVTSTSTVPRRSGGRTRPFTSPRISSGTCWNLMASFGRGYSSSSSVVRTLVGTGSPSTPTPTFPTRTESVTREDSRRGRSEATGMSAWPMKRLPNPCIVSVLL